VQCGVPKRLNAPVIVASILQCTILNRDYISKPAQIRGQHRWLTIFYYIRRAGKKIVEFRRSDYYNIPIYIIFKPIHGLCHDVRIIIRITVRSYYYDVMVNSAKCTKIYSGRRNVNYFILQPIIQRILPRMGFALLFLFLPCSSRPLLVEMMM